jgi:hypothetical protein
MRLVKIALCEAVETVYCVKLGHQIQNLELLSTEWEIGIVPSYFM